MNTEYFDLSDAVEVIAHRAILEPEKVREALRMFFEATAHAVGTDGKAAYKNFGGFTLKRREPRKFFLNGTWYEVPAHFDLHFNPHPDFCRWVNDGLELKDPEGLRVLVDQD